MSADPQIVAAAELVVFEIGSHRLGIVGTCVRSLVRAVAATPLPGAPPGVCGVIDVRGQIVPLFDLRDRLALAAVPIQVSEQFLICAVPAVGTIALRADRIVEIRTLDAPATAPAVVSTDPFVQTLLRLSDGVIVVCDLGALLSGENIDRLAQAIHELVGT